MAGGYTQIKELKELKGHAEAYFINKEIHPDCINVIRMDKVHEDFKMIFIKQLRMWLKEGKLYKI